MFTTTELIRRIRAKAPLFGSRVSGTLSFARATAETRDVGADMATPHCFVVPLSDTTEDATGNMVAQLVTERFATIVCVDQAPDPKDGPGINADAKLREARRQLIDTMLFWAPDPQCGPIRYVRGFHLHMSQARIWHQYEWQVQYYLCRTKEVADAADEEWEAVFADVSPYEHIRKLVANIHVAGEPAGSSTILDLED